MKFEVLNRNTNPRPSLDLSLLFFLGEGIDCHKRIIEFSGFYFVADLLLYYTISNMGCNKFHSVEMRKYISPVPGIKVLVVDGDLACLAIVSKMLRTLGYEVVTATLASDALSIIEEKKNELHLVLMEVHLPDMKIYELIEKIRDSDLPFFIMTADDNQFSISGALCEGAKLYFMKPVTTADLRGLWQFAMWKIQYRTTASEDVRSFGRDQSEGILVNNGLECQPFINTGKQSLQSAKRKVQEHIDKDKGGEKIESLVLKKKRLTWTDDLHKRFLEAVKVAGIDAPPRKIHQLMNVPGLTKENVSSYLQKYRQSLKREANAILQHVNRHSSDLNLGSHHLSQTDNAQVKHFPFLEQQGVTYKPTFCSNYQKDLSSCMSVQFLGTPAHFPSLEISSGQESTVRQNELCLPYKLQGVAYTTCGLGEFKINGNGEASADFSQVENATDGKNFNGDTFLSYVDYTAGKNEMHCPTLLANDMHPQFPVPPLPSDEKEHDIFGAEVEKIDEIFYISKGTQQFNDEDLNMWISSFESS